jgi:hypothetical protein
MTQVNKTLILPAMLLLSISLTASAAPKDAGDPVAGPLEVNIEANSGSPTGFGGGITSFGLRNNSDTATIKVLVHGVCATWSDGSDFCFSLSDFGLKGPVVLLPGETRLAWVFPILAPDTPIGPATATIQAHVSRISDGRRSDYPDSPPALWASHSKAFVVLP